MIYCIEVNLGYWESGWRTIIHEKFDEAPTREDIIKTIIKQDYGCDIDDSFDDFEYYKVG